MSIRRAHGRVGALTLTLVGSLLAAASTNPPQANAARNVGSGGTRVIFVAGEEVASGSVPGDPEDYWRPRELSQFTPAL